MNLLGLDTADLAVVEVFGMLAEATGETQDRVEADLTEPCRGAAAAAVGEMLGDGHQGCLRRAQAEQGGVGTLGEVRTTGDAVQAADAVPAAGPAVQAEVAGTALAVGRTVEVGASQVRVVGGAHRFLPLSPGWDHFRQPRTYREALRRHHQFRLGRGVGPVCGAERHPQAFLPDRLQFSDRSGLLP